MMTIGLVTVFCLVAGTLGQGWPPEFSQCPSDQYHSIADTKPGVNVTWREPYVQDDYGETTQPVQTFGPQSGSILEPGFYTVIYKATDRVGHPVECSFDIEIQAYAAIDVCQSAPCQNGGDCISSSSYSYTCSCALYSGFSGTNCEIPPESFECFLPCENGATCIDTIDWYECRCTPGYTGIYCDVYSPATTPGPTTVDDSPPEFRPCPADIARRIPASNGGVRVTWPELHVEDDSGETIQPVQIFGPRSGSVFHLGSHLIDYEARDSAGNTAFCSFHVRVTAYEPPSIFCPIDIDHWLSSGESSAVITWDMPTVLSSSGHARLTYQSMESGSRLRPGTYTVRYRYTDDSALEASCSFTITIHDSWKPQHPIQGPQHPIQHSKDLTLKIVIPVGVLVVVLAVVMSIGLYMYNKRRSINNGDSSSTCGGMRILKNEHLPAEEPRYSTPPIEKTQEIA
ncbi:sushi, von Willebrand factor type A, EGF and pentraxin domain-containing protein 1-like isoform X2 [Patiria miniata]|uniref:Uncharacterized protein n=1 Tax=Patiria miniata TaxID=46514 RepID=A0A914AUF6_PATMI|nr:sushi, von Willebrand factor type A, EGF and pentraxin domain-containing protein 1-like isoform X2 [Patiria miniata]